MDEAEVYYLSVLYSNPCRGCLDPLFDGGEFCCPVCSASREQQRVYERTGLPEQWHE